MSICHWPSNKVKLPDEPESKYNVQQNVQNPGWLFLWDVHSRLAEDGALLHQLWHHHHHTLEVGFSSSYLIRSPSSYLITSSSSYHHPLMSVLTILLWLFCLTRQNNNFVWPPGETMTGSQCATPVASTINFTGSTGLFIFSPFWWWHKNGYGNRRRTVEKQLMIAMMLTDYNSGRWQCARTGSRRERESQKVKRGAGAGPRTKSKLKVSVFSFFPAIFLSPSICKICRSWLLWRIRCRRLFGRLVALPALISKSATVSNFPFWPVPAPAATQKKRKRECFCSSSKFYFFRSQNIKTTVSLSCFTICQLGM